MPGDEEQESVVEKPKRAPRKRANASVPIADGETPAPVKRAPRKRAPKKVVEEVSERVAPPPSPSPRRKAPTPIAATKATRKSFKRQFAVVVVMMIVGLGTSAAVGVSDKGKIDINKIIEERNRRVESGELQEQIIPVQNTSRLPDGGLIMAEDQTPPPAPVPAATTTASTTDATASSTATSTPVEMGVPATPQELGQPEAPAE